jgi:hypothetical protein
VFIPLLFIAFEIGFFSTKSLMACDDWDLVEIESGGPVIEAVTPTHLDVEWRAAQFELASAQRPGLKSAWSKFLRLYRLLRKKDQLRAEGVLNRVLSDLEEMMASLKYSSVRHFLFSVYADLYSVEMIPLVGYASQFVLPPLNALPEIVSEIDPDTLDRFVEPLQADLVIDGSHRTLFLDFLVRSYTFTGNGVGQKSRNLILQILEDQNQRESAARLKAMLIESFGRLFEFVAKISPTVLPSSQLFDIFKFANKALMLVRDAELIAILNGEVSQKVIAPLMRAPPYLQLTTFSLFLGNVTLPTTLSLFIESIVDINGVFRLRFECWRENWTLDLLKLISAMLDTRSSAIRSAFFSSPAPNAVGCSPVYCFVREGTLRVQRKRAVPVPSFDRQTIDRYRFENPELPPRRPQIVSLFDFLLGLFARLWTLPIETAAILLSAMEKMAALGTRSVYDFCFTQGGPLFSVAFKLMQERDAQSPESRDLLESFVATMRLILDSHPLPET